MTHNKNLTDLKPRILEPLSEITGVVGKVIVKNNSLIVVINYELELLLAFESKRELESGARSLRRQIGKVVGIFLDDNGVPHIRSYPDEGETGKVNKRRPSDD
jgi:hypothetical protein